MKRYKTIFYSFHTLFRLITTSTDMSNFIIGASRIYKNVFCADKVMIVCRNLDSKGLIKISLEEDKQFVKKGGLSILARYERDILAQEKSVLLSKRMVYPFCFSSTLGMVYLRRNPGKEVFNEMEKKWFLSFSEEVTMSLKIFNLYREQKKMLIGYMEVLTKYLEQYNTVHTQIIIRLIRAVGKKMNLSELETKSLEYASLLHDAGEIQVPSKILRKEKPLTEEEFKIIMKHPRKGVKLIKDLDILRPVVPIILHHHERFDGRGYPSKLKNKQIPLGARVLSIIDSFDAMFFGRPYKKRMPLEIIETELKKQKANQFDPKIVDIFLKILKRKDIRKYLHSLAQNLIIKV